MANWKDITGYQRGEERIPRSWKLEIANLRLIVTRRFQCDGWYIDMEPWFAYSPLKATDGEDAKNEALLKARVALGKTLADLG